ncbi:MAG: PilW family protein, partial [Myxococcota bacterium]
TTRYPTAADAIGIPNGLALISGVCDTTDPFSGFKEITSDTPSGAFQHVYTVAAPTSYVGLQDIPDGSCTNWANDFTMSQARVTDFYVVRDDTTGESNLVMNVNQRTGDPSTEQIVAFNIDSLQVRYGIDVGSTPTDTVPDQQADTFCDDLSDTNSCSPTYATVTTTRPTNPEILAARVVAVQVGVIPRAGTRIVETTNFAAFDVSLPPTDTAAATGRGYDGALRRWVFRGSVRLRNNELE